MNLAVVSYVRKIVGNARDTISVSCVLEEGYRWRVNVDIYDGYMVVNDVVFDSVKYFEYIFVLFFKKLILVHIDNILVCESTV